MGLRLDAGPLLVSGPDAGVVHACVGRRGVHSPLDGGLADGTLCVVLLPALMDSGKVFYSRFPK